MKFFYEYRTHDNKLIRGTVAAASRDRAYSLLKASGIRPSRVTEAPGLFNRLFGKGKRWMLIAVLFALLLAAGWALFVAVRERNETARELEDVSLFEDRGQIYGPAAVLAEMEANGYASVFSNAFDRSLAAYAIPGRAVDAKKIRLTADFRRDWLARPIDVGETELDEVKRLKRMVNGLRRELAQYLADGGSVVGYFRRLDIRQRAEMSIYSRAQKELARTDDADVWKKTNAMLRAKGLPMVEQPASQTP